MATNKQARLIKTAQRKIDAAYEAILAAIKAAVEATTAAEDAMMTDSAADLSFATGRLVGTAETVVVRTTKTDRNNHNEIG